MLQLLTEAAEAGETTLFFCKVPSFPAESLLLLSCEVSHAVCNCLLGPVINAPSGRNLHKYAQLGAFGLRRLGRIGLACWQLWYSLAAAPVLMRLSPTMQGLHSPLPSSTVRLWR